MMQRLAMVAVAGAMVTALGGLSGCAEREVGREVDPDRRMIGDRGLQSRDLREMTTQLAPDLRAIPELGPGRQTKAVVVMKSIENRTSEPGRDMDIYLHRLKVLLNKEPSIRNDIAFVETAETLGKLQAQELGGGGDPFGDAGRAPEGPSPRVRPQYVLKGIFYEKREARSAYFLCTFQLTDINTGVQVWENSYEVKTLE